MSILDDESRRRGTAHHGVILNAPSAIGFAWARCRDCDWESEHYRTAAGASLALAAHVAERSAA